MNKYDIVRKIEEFAPTDTQEKWDCSGWGVNVGGVNVGGINAEGVNAEGVNVGSDNIQKILFALTVTDDIVSQAREKGCDMIISHHPLFYVPYEWKDINIYCAHTNLDKAEGGTTDTLIKKLGFKKTESYEFVRIVKLDKPIAVKELREKLLTISPKLRYVNNYNKQYVQMLAFCAGSGSEFINETVSDCFITGDLKFHSALEAKQVVFDIGHYESEVFAKELLKEITGVGENGVMADEKSPFI